MNAAKTEVTRTLTLALASTLSSTRALTLTLTLTFKPTLTLTQVRLVMWGQSQEVTESTRPSDVTPSPSPPTPHLTLPASPPPGDVAAGAHRRPGWDARQP